MHAHTHTFFSSYNGLLVRILELYIRVGIDPQAAIGKTPLLRLPCELIISHIRNTLNLTKAMHDEFPSWLLDQCSLLKYCFVAFLSL